jgi:hypothetical protein
MQINKKAAGPLHDPQRAPGVVLGSANSLVQLLRVLTEVRSGRLPNAIEYLEFLVDSELVTISEGLTNVQTRTKELVLPIVSQVHSYRTSWPRKLQPELFNHEGSVVIREAADKAARFLGTALR